MKLATKKEVKAFVEKAPYLVRGMAEYCPIAQATHEKNGRACRVLVRQWKFYNSDFGFETRRLPKWARTFVKEFDESDGSKAAALAILKELGA